MKIKVVHDQAIRHYRLGRNKVLWQILKQFPLEYFTHILKHSMEHKNPWKRRQHKSDLLITSKKYANAKSLNNNFEDDIFLRMRDSYTNPSEMNGTFVLTKRIHKMNLSKTGLQNESFKTGLRNESTKQIFWNQYGFANPKPRICMDSDLFKVCLCTMDSSGFVRICWIRENRSNLLKISQRNDFMKQIFWKH